MPKSETSNPNNGPSFQAPRYRPNWVEAVICFILGSYLTVALIAYEPAQSTFVTTEPILVNPVGRWGANAIWVLLFSIGASTWLLPIFLFWMLYVAMRNTRHLVVTRVVAMVIAAVALACIASMFNKEGKLVSDYFPKGPGGLAGLKLYNGLLADALGTFGSFLLFGTIYVFALMFIFTKDISLELERYLMMFQTWWAARKQRKALLAAQTRKPAEEAGKAKAPVAVAPGPVAAPGPIGPSGKKIFVPKSVDDPLAKAPAAATGTAGAETPKLPTTAPFAKAEPSPAAAKAAEKHSEPSVEAKAAVPAKKLELNIVKPEETKKAKTAVLPARNDDKDYEFPPLALLKEQIKPTAASSERAGNSFAAVRAAKSPVKKNIHARRSPSCVIRNAK